MVQRFDLLISATSQLSMRKLLKGTLRHLNEGESLPQSFAHYPKYFDRLFVSLVSAGEQGGILSTIPLRLADYRKKRLALTKKVTSAMFYPAAILTVMIFVIPAFAHLSSSFGATLQLLTQVVIKISDWMKEHWYVVVGAPIAAVFLFHHAYRRSDKLREDAVFPLMATQMFAIGEETGAIEVMSGKVADSYENEVNEAINRTTMLVEPIIMVILGIVAGPGGGHVHAELQDGCRGDS
ncbi:type II secretion system F family protein [Acidithiobacillus sp. AMEEHan]|uniref:type II secretion system F family protein n=1 Tax=Acidithiobacillus sp. AMEEHan TaxID=2994951 RepID=UPI0027E54A15|nr:type II secretion system F family protein [Acidithiobacillus sp. AMEEHan]